MKGAIDICGRIGVLLFATVAISNRCNAQQVSVDDARIAAVQFMKDRAGGHLTRSEQFQMTEKDLKLEYTEFDEKDAPVLYVFSPSDYQGFVITSADERVDAILGYSYDTPFHADNLPEATKGILKNFQRQISYARANNINTRNKAFTRAADRKPIPYLVSSKWGQLAPYNEFCPTAWNKKMETGCVATAMAQIMYYHKHPQKGTGSHSYVWNNQTLSADFGNTEYHLDQLKDTYSRTDTPENDRKLIGTLMYHCGVSVDMNYLQEGGGDSEISGYPFSAYFGYSDSYYWINPSDFDDEESLMAKIYDELSHGRPLLAGGSNWHYGHAYVCDGYDTGDYLHYNIGWEGNSDGYYKGVIVEVEGDDPYSTGQYLAGLRPRTESVEINGLLYEVNGNEAFLVGTQGSTTKVVIPEVVTYQGQSLNVKNVSRKAFRNNSKITSVTIPGSVTALHDSLFVGCTNLKEVVIQDSDVPLSHEWETFIDCPVEKLYMGRNFMIGFQARMLKDLTIGPKVTTLPSYAFGSSQLSEVYIPATVLKIDSLAFSWCEQVKSYEVEASNPAYCSVDGVMYDKQQTTLKKYPPQKPQTSFTVPSSVTAIDCHALRMIPVEILALSEGLKTLGSEAISHASRVQVMYVPCMTPPVCGQDALVNCAPNGVVYVPEGTLSLYKQAPEWKNLNLKEMSLEEMRAAIPTGISVIKTDEESNIYYDLRGQRVKTPTKGIYIRNGKKEVIR